MKLLLDEHLSPRLADIVRSLAPELDVLSIHQWQHGRFTNQPDERILRAAAAEGRTLVTFDLRTIPRVLAEFGVCGESHAGVLFISAKSFAANDFKAVGRALVNVAGRTAGEEWTNRVEFLTKT